jgi:Flp pilus assembly protein TadD
MDSGFELDDPPFGYEPPPLQPALYPRRYRAAMVWKAFGFIVLVAGLALCFFHPASALLALVGLLSLIDALRREIVLRADAIEVQGLWRHRVVALGQIEGVRVDRQPFGLRAITRLIVRRGDGGHLRLDGAWQRDAAFDAWLARLPDLDAADRRAAREVILSDPNWGDASDERWHRWQRWQITTRIAVFALSALVIASMFWRRDLEAPQVAVAMLPLALLAVVAAAGGRLRIDLSRSDLRPGVFRLLLLACVALAVRQFTEVALQHWADILPATALLGALLAWWAWWLSPRRLRDAKRWPAVPLLFVYAGSALVLLNTRLDDAGREAREQAVVTGKHFSGGRWRLFTLDVNPVDVRSDKQTFTVPLATYNNVSPGETVCLQHHPGRFGWPWSDIRPCDTGGARAATAAGQLPDPLRRALQIRAFPPERRGPLLKLLFAEHFDELDEQLDALQRRFERHDIGSMDLLVAYRDFYDPNPELDPLFDAWVARHAKSYGARLARGIHRKFQAVELHNAGFEKWVSPQANLEAVLDRQIDDLEQSISLTTQPILSYVHLMDAARARGERAHLRELLDRGLVVEPGSLALTRKYMAMLGRPDARDEFLAECRAARMPAATLNTLEAMVLTRRAQNLRYAKDEDSALALAQQAAALEPVADELTMAVREAASILTRRGQDEAALALLERASQATPTDGAVHAGMATSLWRLGRRDESIQQIRTAAELDWASSQAYLGELYLKGEGVPKDEAQAHHWLNKAAASGNERARQLLRDNPSLR